MLTMDDLTLITALILTAVFSVAGITKLADRPGTREAVREFGGPVLLVPPIALLLPLIELAVAVALLFPATRVGGAGGALGLLALFAVAIAVSLARGKAPDCHCFGQLHSAPASWKTLARNGVLGSLAAGLLVATSSDAGISPWARLTAATATELAFTAGAVASIAVVSAVGLTLLSLTRAYGRVLLRLEATEKALLEAGIEVEDLSKVSELGLDPGTPAPAFEMKRSDASTVTLDHLLAPAIPLLLVFTTPGCGPCHALLPAVARWQRKLGDRLTTAVASAGEPEAIRRQEAEYGLAAMLVDSDLALSEAYLTSGTPSAVLIAPDGTIASYVAGGPDEIESLVDRVLAAPSDEGLPVGSPAPTLELRGIEGDVEPLVDPLGQSTVLLFWNPGCGYCQSMLPALLAWEQDRGYSDPRLLVVSSGDREGTIADGFRSTVVLDPEFEIGQAFEAGGTPMAVVVDADGKIASPLVTGGEAVLTRLAGTRVGLERR